MKKRKKVLLITIIVIILGVAIGSIYVFKGKEEEIGPEISVLNPGFETLDESSKPEFWSESKKRGWFIDAGHPHSGRNCMRATVSWSYLEQKVAVNSGKWYALEAYVKSDISVPEKDYANTFLSLECISRKKVITSDYGIVNATSSWQLKKVLIYAPKGTKKIRIKLAKRKGEGNVWFDDVKLTEFSSGLILNPGFETLDESSKPEFWSESKMGGWSVDTEHPYSGRNCMRATASWSYLEQEICIKSGKCYTLEAYIESDIIILEEDYRNTFLTLECLSGENEVLNRDYGIVNATSSWQLKEALVYAPKGTKRVRIKLAKRKGEGSVWFDDVKLIEKPWYLKMKFIRKASKDKLFFIFYGCVYLILIVSLLRILLKRASKVKKS